MSLFAGVMEHWSAVARYHGRREVRRDWMIELLVEHVGGDIRAVRAAVDIAVPRFSEHVFDGGPDFAFALDSAALIMGAVPIVAAAASVTLH